MQESESQEPEGKKNSILVTYHGDVNRIPMSPVNGAYGGSDPYAELIVANFYCEKATVPVASTLPIDDEGVVQVGMEETDKRSDLQRVIVATLTMTPGAARRIGHWLVGQADRIDPQS